MDENKKSSEEQNKSKSMSGKKKGGLIMGTLGVIGTVAAAILFGGSSNKS